MPTVTINANADATVLQTGASSNYGSASNLTIVGVSSMRELFVNFDLSAIPNTARINSAVVILRMYSNNGSGTIFAERVTSSWAESTVTWNTRPSVVANTDGSVATGTTNNVDINVPVTSIVKSWFESGTARYGIKFWSSTSATNYFRSKESAAPNDLYNPRLYVDYTEVPAFQVNVGDVWKQPSAMYVNIGDVWRQVVQAYVNVGDVWREVK